MRRALTIVAGLGCLALLGAASARAQAAPQPTLYTYVALWGVPRAQWGAMDSFMASTQQAMDKLVDNGTLTGYGTCTYEVHEPPGFTHCNWFQATSLGNILRALDSISASAAASPALASAKHIDQIVQSRMYGGRSGTYHDGYMWLGHFTLKPGAAGDWSRMFGTFIRPELDKLVADGTVVAYQLDTPLVHTPGSADTLDYGFVTTSPDGIGKYFAAVGDIESQNSAIPVGISSFEEPAGHYDLILKIHVMRWK